MPAIGYHASHEQWNPKRLLELTQRAAAAGFTGGMCSDHFAPWSELQGESGYAWSWLGAALQSTSLPFGAVTAPGYRYHPAVVAQSIATLGIMFPGRFWVALGSGEALNESITGLPWPPKKERQQRLAACADIIRRLLMGESVSSTGTVRVENARLWSRPEQVPPLFVAALSPETAAMHAAWADGLITVNTDRTRLRAILDAFRANGGAGKPIALQVHVSWAASMAEAQELAFRHWRNAAVPPHLSESLPSPEAFDRAVASVEPEDMSPAVRISNDLDQHTAWIREDVAMGIDRIYLHQVGPNQDSFIDRFGAEVLPRLHQDR